MLNRTPTSISLGCVILAVGIIILFATALSVPILFHGSVCGDDSQFHLISWSGSSGHHGKAAQPMEQVRRIVPEVRRNSFLPMDSKMRLAKTSAYQDVIRFADRTFIRGKGCGPQQGDRHAPDRASSKEPHRPLGFLSKEETRTPTSFSPSQGG